MLEFIVDIYVTILPIIIGATVSTIIVKQRVLAALRRPIDGGIKLADGKRLFGDNKTWLGLIGLVIMTSVATVLWGIVCASNPGLEAQNWLYRLHENTWQYNVGVGALLGLAYGLFELPNSFLKRRQSIAAGQVIQGAKGIPNVLLDHTDSIIGCAVVLLALSHLTIGETVGVVLVGVATHLFVNYLLVIGKVKKNI